MARVCIIEDDLAFAAALRRVLSAEHSVTCFSSVPDDAEEFMSLNPEVIFLDCMLPGESGPEFLSRLRGDERTRNVAIIMMSAYHEMAEESHLAAFGYQEFLKKPCSIREIQAIVERYSSHAPALP